jgi:antitoxin MazE
MEASMGVGTKTRIVKIGNSRGVRIPSLLLAQAELGVEVELEAHKGQVIIRASRGPRSGWEERFAEMSRRGDDALLDPEAVTLSSWDEAEWKW